MPLGLEILLTYQLMPYRLYSRVYDNQNAQVTQD